MCLFCFVVLFYHVNVFFYVSVSSDVYGHVPNSDAIDIKTGSLEWIYMYVCIAIWQGKLWTSLNVSTCKVRLKFCLHLNQNGNQGPFKADDKQPSSVCQPKVIITNSYKSFILLKVINVSAFFGTFTAAKSTCYLIHVHPISLYRCSSHWMDFHEIWYWELNTNLSKKIWMVNIEPKYKAQWGIYEDISVFYIVDSDIWSITINRTYCCIAMAMLSIFIKLLAGTYAH